MILAVCLNPALDVTYHVDVLVPGATHRVRSVRERAGGKASNAAHVLAQLGEEVALFGFAGGSRGERFRSALGAVHDRLTCIQGETRQSVAVVDADDVTVLNEPGPAVAGHEWEALLDDYTAALPAARAVALAGSLPSGLPDDAYAQLVRLARRSDRPTVLDTGGPQLLTALAERPTVAAPNHHEAAEALGSPLSGPDEALVAAADLSGRSGGAVVVSVGRDGLVAATPQRRWRAAPPRVLAGNPTGAGDACDGRARPRLADGRCLARRARDAVALSACGRAAPDRGRGRSRDLRELRPLCRVEEVR